MATQTKYYQCTLKIRGTEVAAQNIMSLTIREWAIDLLPILEASLFEEGLMVEFKAIQPGDLVDVEIAYDRNSPSVKATFEVVDYDFAPISVKRSNTINITAVLYAPNMTRPIQNRAFRNKTSIAVASSIADECKMKFVKVPTSITAVDQMTWLQVNSSNLQFLQDTAKRAYVKEDDVVLLFCNTKGQLIYSSLTGAIANSTEPKIARYDPSMTVATSLTADQERTLWFHIYNVINVSGSVNLQGGYGTKLSYYALDGESTDKTIESKPAYLSDQAFQADIMGQVTNRVTFGYYGSAHDNMLRALAQNDRIQRIFFANSLVMSVNATQEVALLDTINVAIPSTIGDPVNVPWSGTYLVGGIVHNISNTGTYRKWLNLYRNGTNAVKEIAQ